MVIKLNTIKFRSITSITRKYLPTKYFLSFYLLSIITLFSYCKDNSKEKLYLVNTMIDANKIIYSHFGKICTSFEKSLVENKAKTKPWKNKLDSIHIKLDEILDYIQKIRGFAIEDNPVLWAKHVSDWEMNSEDTKILYEKTEDYKKLLYAIFDKVNSKEKIHKMIDTSLNYSDLMELDTDENTLAMLSNDLLLTTYKCSQFLYSKIESGRWQYNKIEAVVIPKTRYIKNGENYEAEVFFVMMDTTLTPIVIVNNDTLPVKDGKAYYTKTVTEKAGTKVNWKGKLFLISPTTGEALIYPFQSEYQVIQ